MAKRSGGRHEAWQRSDLNQREYCEAQGIPLKAFGNWRAKFKAEPQPPTRKLLYRRGGLSHTLSHSLSHPLSHVTYPSSLDVPVVPQLGFEDLGADIARVEATLPSAAAKTPSTRLLIDRPSMPARLPREEMRLDFEQQACPCCGRRIAPDRRDGQRGARLCAGSASCHPCRPRYGCRACGTIHQGACP
jgi:hypothetical protein